MDKTKLLKLTWLVLIIMFQINVRGQQNFQSGYIINLNSDTIRGQINYRNWDRNPKRIEFRNEGDTKAIYYTPVEINAFNVAGENYISAIVSVDKSPYKINELDHSGDLKMVNDTVFLEVIAAGSRPGYYLKDNDGKLHFFVKGGNGIELLFYKEYLADINGLVTLVKNENYKDRLKFYLQECPALTKKIQRMSYTLSSMQDLFNEYYICKGISPPFQKKKEKNKSEFGIFAGASLTKLKFNSSATAAFKVVYTNFHRSASFTGGIFYNIYLSRNLNKLSINNELIYSSYKTDGIYEEYSNTTTTKKTTITFDFSYVKLNTLFRYTYPMNPVSLYATAGMSNGLAVGENSFKREVTTYNNTETVKDGPALNDIRKYEQGYIIGLGARYKNYSCEARFENGNGMSEYSRLNSTAKRYYFLLGYKF